MSLVEVLVTVLILGVAMSAMAASSLTALASSRVAQDHVNGAQAVNEVVEHLLTRPFAEIAPATFDAVTTPAYTPVVRAGVTHSIAVDVVWVDDACNGAGVAPAPGQPDARKDYLEMNVTVAWTVKAVTRSLDAVMFRTPRPGESAVAGGDAC